MLVLAPLVLVGALLIAHRNREHLPPGQGSGPGWFAAWTAAGALLAFSFVTGLSIGILLLPFGAIALFVIASRARFGRETFGLLAGTGIVFVFVGLAAGAGGWIASGLVCVAASAVGYLAPRGRQAL